MRTEAILALTLSSFLLLIPGSRADGETTALPSPHLSNVTESAETSSDESAHLSDPTGTPAKGDTTQGHTTQGDTTKGDTTQTSSSRVTSSYQTTSQRNQRSSTETTKGTSPAPSKPINYHYKLPLFLILLAVMVLMLCVGCIHTMREGERSQNCSAHGLLLGVRTRISNLEDRMGLRLWPAGKRGGEEDDIEEGPEEDGGQGTEAEHKAESGSDSHDSSSMEADDLEGRQEEEREQSGKDDREETSSDSEESQSTADGGSSVQKHQGSEERALVSSVQDDDEAESSDITVL